ncbi:MAG: PIG-L family deacetylase [Saprospiraceae bacterium]
MRKLYILSLLLLFSLVQLSAQAPKRWAAADIYQGIQKSQFLGSALFVAAHPDDENTGVISYLANEVKAETAYLSLTRGDGGQNLIGTELKELLGVIRTQELLAARRVDGGSQMFSRANDFGYSKHPDETLAMWNEDEVLSDVVWAIRKWRPDVVINRFDHNSAGKTHGHHTSSAILSYAAFDLAGDKTKYPEQLKHVEAWKPQRLFLNTSWWFYGSREAFAKADKSKMVAKDINVYFPLKAMSNPEIAAISRGQHKCQGMGRSLSRSGDMEYLDVLKGDVPPVKDDLFSGINTTWSRVKGGDIIGKMLGEVERNFDFANPAASVPALVKAHQAIQKLPDSYWKEVKGAAIQELILASLGMFIEAVADDYSAVPGEEVELKMEVAMRLAGNVTVEKVKFLPTDKDTTLNLKLETNAPQGFFNAITIPVNTDYTAPYWLKDSWEGGMYTVENQLMRGLPETPRALKAEWTLLIENQPFTVQTDIVFKAADPVKGEYYRPFEVLPSVFASIDKEVYIFADTEPKMVDVLVKSGKENVSGTVKLNYPKGWRTEPASQDFQLDLKGAEEKFTFKLFPPKGQSEGKITPVVSLENDSKTYEKELVLIEYDHIPTQSVLRQAESKVVNIELEKAGKRIGYIMGAGDKIPESLREIGYEVDLLEDNEITTGNLAKYDAVITGIRAYNTNKNMKFHQPKLFEYAENGGTLIVQYNTTWRMPFPSEQLAPYFMKLSRDRISVETAPLEILTPDHPVVNYPNKITQADFSNWVQERGLYFPNEWDEEHFTAILSGNDPGEDAKKGGLLVAPHGKGHYVYTGYSWFRELPAGVPGAYRLFTNLISLGKAQQ